MLLTPGSNAILNSLLNKHIPLLDGKLENFRSVNTKEGLYSVWWTGDLSFLKSLNLDVSFQGKQTVAANAALGILAEYEPAEWTWSVPDRGPVCMYVGKSTNVQNRLRQHVADFRRFDTWYEDRESHPPRRLLKRNSACQVRAGIEHLFRNYPTLLSLDDKLSHFSYSFESETCFQERFYAEDLAIGVFRPWFNLDCER